MDPKEGKAIAVRQQMFNGNNNRIRSVGVAGLSLTGAPLCQMTQLTGNGSIEMIFAKNSAHTRTQKRKRYIAIDIVGNPLPKLSTFEAAVVDCEDIVDVVAVLEVVLHESHIAGHLSRSASPIPMPSHWPGV